MSYSRWLEQSLLKGRIRRNSCPWCCEWNHREAVKELNLPHYHTWTHLFLINQQGLQTLKYCTMCLVPIYSLNRKDNDQPQDSAEVFFFFCLGGWGVKDSLTYKFTNKCSQRASSCKQDGEPVKMNRSRSLQFIPVFGAMRRYKWDETILM